MLEPLRQNLFHPLKFWRVNFLLWCGFGVLAFLMRAAMHEELPRAVQMTLSTQAIGFFLSGLLRYLYQKAGPQRVLRPSFIFQAILLTALVAGLHAVLMQTLLSCLNLFYPPSGASIYFAIWQRWLAFTILMWFVYLSWTFAYLWLKAEFHSQAEIALEAKARAEIQQMELQLIRFQLDPHFLFNSLNGIAAEIPAHPKIASHMVDELATYLKYSLDHRHELITPLSVELDATASYLRIQKSRFGSKLQSRITASPKARKILVPSFILQPLVENAFKYGHNKTSTRRTLLVTAKLHSGHLILQIKNSGFLSTPRKGSGLGLDAVRRRLEVRYPNRYHFTLTEQKGFVLATLNLQGEPCSV